MRLLVAIIILFHGLIHLLGFIKGMFPDRLLNIQQTISKRVGSLWLSAGILFIVSSIFLLMNLMWWGTALLGILLSQVLIIKSWRDTRYGTIINIILLLACISQLAEWNFKNDYQNEATETIRSSYRSGILTEEDIQHLPDPVQRYIRYHGAVDKPRVNNFKVKFTGRIRQDEQSDWMPIETEQVNLINPPTRLFFMSATMKHLPVSGFHAYRNGNATMDIRLFSLFQVQYQSGREMDVAETVTWFNDLCLYAPGELADERITWQPIDSATAKATYTFKDISITAVLHFDPQGKLINFISDDRYRIVNELDKKLIQFSTPITDYREFSGYQVPEQAATIWNLPNGLLTYGEFSCTLIEYNLLK